MFDIIILLSELLLLNKFSPSITSTSHEYFLFLFIKIFRPDNVRCKVLINFISSDFTAKLGFLFPPSFEFSLDHCVWQVLLTQWVKSIFNNLKKDMYKRDFISLVHRDVKVLKHCDGSTLPNNVPFVFVDKIKFVEDVDSFDFVSLKHFFFISIFSLCTDEVFLV